MGAYSYCKCGNGQTRPSIEELLYGRACKGCGNWETFTNDEKIEGLLNAVLELQERADQATVTNILGGWENENGS